LLNAATTDDLAAQKERFTAAKDLLNHHLDVEASIGHVDPRHFPQNPLQVRKRESMKAAEEAAEAAKNASFAEGYESDVSFDPPPPSLNNLWDTPTPLSEYTPAPTLPRALAPPHTAPTYLTPTLIPALSPSRPISSLHALTGDLVTAATLSRTELKATFSAGGDRNPFSPTLKPQVMERVSRQYGNYPLLDRARADEYRREEVSGTRGSWYCRLAA